MKLKHLAAFVTVGAMASGLVGQAKAAPIQWTIDSGGNVHWYELIETPTNAWTDAREAAKDKIFKGMPGYLVTITSQAENDFLYDTFNNGIRHAVWIGLTDNETYGGQESGNPTHPGSPYWVWTTGEPVAYTNWINGEPNNLFDDDYAEFVFTNTEGKVGGWNDLPSPHEDPKSNQRFYVVEYGGGYFDAFGYVPFGDFNAQINIKLGPLDDDDAFDVKATFMLGGSSNGINPLGEDVSIQIGDFSRTILAGSFNQDKKGRFRYEGVIDGVTLEAVIKPLGSGKFEFAAEGKSADLSGAMVPVMLGLTIGDDKSITTLTNLRLRAR